MSVRRLTPTLATIALVAAVPAHAEWLRATSPHFVVYANTTEDALRRKAAELERFDALIRRFHKAQANADAESNRVTVYVLPDVAAVQRMGGMKNVYGFYVPRITGSIAFTPLNGDSGKFALSPRMVLFHEYAHHFLLGNYAIAYPAWFTEGYAEFVSTVVEEKGALWLGAAANHRSWTLFNGKSLTIQQLFQPPPALNALGQGDLYARGWLLTHLIMFDAMRRQQFGAYLKLLNGGKPSLAAAQEAFGDLRALDRQLDVYLKRRSLPAIRVDPATLPPAPIDVVALTPGQAAMMLIRMQSERGVNARTAPLLYATAQTTAAAWPKDAVVQGWLAEAAFDARQLDGAEAAADAALAVDPNQVQALSLKGNVRLRRAAQAPATDPAVWTEARTWIAKANRASNNDAAALALFYQSFLMQRTTPSRNAVAALYRANELVPQDPRIRFLAARQMLQDGETDRARQLLQVIAASPHAAPDNAAARLLALIDAGQTGPAAVEALRKAAENSQASRGAEADERTGAD
jgi:Flp pilus assembly protein TadD